MKEKKSNGLLVVVAILCLLIGLVGGYFLFGKEVLNANNKDDEQTIANDMKKCKYNKLKSTSELTNSEIDEILKLVNRSSAEIVSVDEYMYEVYSEVFDVGPDVEKSFYTTVWKENGQWVKGEILNSRYNSDEESFICKECGECVQTNNKLTVVSDPVYNRITETLPKGLVGKYVNTQDDGHTYIEFKDDGTIDVSLSACEGISKYTNRQIKYTGFYAESTKSFELSIREGSYNFGGNTLSLHFDVVGDIESGNVSLKAAGNYGCNASNVYKK